MVDILITLKDAVEKIFKLPTGQKHQVALIPPKVHVLDVEDSHFNFDRRVLLPDLSSTDNSTPVLDVRRVTGIGVIYAALVHADKHPDQGLYVTGHTDSSGAASYNQRLSEERAKNVSLLLRGLRDDWRKQAAQDDAVDDYQTLLKWQHQRAGWDCDPGPINNKLTNATRLAIGRFQERYNEEVKTATSVGKDSPFLAKIGVDNQVGKETWGAFYDLYMDELMDLLDLKSYSALQQRQAKLKAPPDMIDFAGCGEHIPFNPRRRNPFEKGTDEHLEGPQKNPPDRRVEILFFDPGEEVPLVCHPNPGQCKPAECPVYIKAPHRQEPIGIPKGLTLAEVNLRLTFVDPEGQIRPFPEGLEVEAKFGDPADDPGPPGIEDPFSSDADAGATNGTAGPGAAAPSGSPGADPDAESMEVDQEPNEKVGPDGRLRFVIPRKASSLYLRILAGDERRFVTADPKKLDDQKLATGAEAQAAVGQGRVFFKLPREFNTQQGYWKGPDGVKFNDGRFLDIDNRATQIGSREAPAELRLEIHWQHFKFEFFDRWTSSMTTVPQPRSKGSSGADVPPLVMEGMPELFDPTINPLDAVAHTAWEIVKGKETIHCLAWLRRQIITDQPRRDLPDDKCTVRFEFAAQVFVRTEGDGKSPDADRQFVAFSPGDSAPLTAGADRLRLYDLPTHWRSTGYPVRLGGETIDKARPFQAAVATPSSLDKPYVASLDTIVLEDSAHGPDAKLVWDDSRLENRFAIYDHQMQVYKPDPPSGEPYFTKLPKKPEGAVLLDFPPFTRLIARGVVLYDVFDERTPRGIDFKDAPIGARFARRFVQSGVTVSSAFALSASVYGAPHPNASHGSIGDLGQSIAVVLRCSGHDGDVELFHAIQFVSVNFDFQPTNLPANPLLKNAVLLPSAPSDAATQVRDCLVKVADRWNGKDSVHSDPVSFEIGKPVTARGKYSALLLHGVRSKGPTADAGEIRINVFRTVRAFMNGSDGFWAQDDLKPDGDAFVGAHEFGHVFSYPDEYLNQDREPSLNQPNISESQRSAGTPYGLDPSGMMNTNLKVRARYFWDLMLFARDNNHFAADTDVAVVHGPRRFITDLTSPNQSQVRFPVSPMGLNAAVGPLGLCDRFLYITGHDEWTAGELGGSSLANPYDGLIVVRVKMAWTFSTITDFHELKTLLERAHRVIADTFNVQRRLVVRGLRNGKPVRLRALFAPRSICKTFPEGDDSQTYLQNDLIPPAITTGAYSAQVTQLIGNEGVHVEIQVGSGGLPGVTGTATPRQARVGLAGAFVRIFTDGRFDDDVVRMFSQMVGLASETVDSPNRFRPLVTGLPNLVVTSLEFVT